MARNRIIISIIFFIILISISFILPKRLTKDSKLISTANILTKDNTASTVKEKTSTKITDRTPVKKNLYIALDPGHGGKDYGTVSGKLLEKNINLDIANRLKKSLVNNGYHVLMTRERDIFLADRSSIKGSLELRDVYARTKLLNSSAASLFVSLHVDCDPSQPLRNGSIVYYNPSIKDSNKLAAQLQNELNKVSVNGHNRADNISSTADFYILKNTDIPGVLVETGFISNKSEKEGFLQEKFRTDLANAICNGIKKYNLNFRN